MSNSNKTGILPPLNQISEASEPAYEPDSTTSSTQTGSRIPHNAKILTNMVFARLRAIYGNKFEQAFGNSEEAMVRTKREWALALAPFDAPSTERALEHCKRNMAWPPSIAEFLALLEQATGMPSARSAYEEACRCRITPAEFAWTHPVIYHTASEVGFWRLQTEAEYRTWPDFQNAWRRNMERLRLGEDFTMPSPPQALPDQRSLSAFEQIEALIEAYQLPEALAYRHLGYLLQNSAGLRATLRQQAGEALHQAGFEVDLPK